MSAEKRRLIYILCWLVALAAIFTLMLLTFGYADESAEAEKWNRALAIMMLAIPGVVMILDMAFFFTFEKFYTAVRFATANFFLVLIVTFLVESAAVLLLFGIEQPQVKLFIFAGAFALATALLNLLQSGFLKLAMYGKKKRR
jgi:membrane-associated HD superfamily phosphohydrolase